MWGLEQWTFGNTFGEVGDKKFFKMKWYKIVGKEFLEHNDSCGDLYNYKIEKI